MAGYSGTPLPKKLGIRERDRVSFPSAPTDFPGRLAPMPADVEVVDGSETGLDLVVVFTTTRADLTARFADLSRRIRPAGILWVAWPKKASGVATDLNENVVRDTGLAAGLVDTKVCAIDDVWSGLKFVYRLKDRPGGAGRRPP